MNQKSRRTLLIVEDSEPDREIIKYWVGKDPDWEYQFLEASSSQEAIKLCDVSKIDCVLIDLELPDLSGIELIAHLIGKYGKLFWPVVMLSGHGNEQHAVQALKLGAQDFISKATVEGAGLARAINQAVERKTVENRREQEVFELRKKVQTLLQERNKLVCELEDKEVEIAKLAKRTPNAQEASELA